MTPTARQWLAGGTALVVLLALAFSAGRYSAPETVEVREVEVEAKREAERSKVTYVDRRTIARGETRVVVRDRWIEPDAGVVREREVETTGRTETIRAETSGTDERAAERVSERIVEKERRVEVRPDWRVGVLAGASLREPLVPIAGPLVLGVSVERRIVGGLSAGAWANTVGAAGASLSLEF